jgi:predicted nucleotidyltransferase
VWLHIWTPVDLWNFGLDSRFEFLDAVSASFPIYDNGFLGALRISNIHKSLVLRRFERYVATYAIAGSLVRGTAGKDSDVDVFVIIDDTDVKRMNRVELLEKLRSIITGELAAEAAALAGTKNPINIQTYLLTDFWLAVKDAQPIMFTFIRDGIPMYDRGTFIPWKMLLKSGRVKPSAEAIELYMKEWDRTEDFIKRRMLDGMVDIYFGVVTPTQAMFMLAGEAPPVPKDIVNEARKIFVEREKVMKLSDLKTLEKAVHLYKQYEYGKLKEIPGKDIDAFLNEAREYNKMIRDLRKKLEKKMQEKTAEEVYQNVFKLLKIVLGDKSQEQLVKSFEKDMAKKGKISPKFLSVLKEIVSVKKKIKEGKLSQKDSESVRRDAMELVDALVEYAQRADLLETEKSMMEIVYDKNRRAELVLFGSNGFIVEGMKIRKLSVNGIEDSNKAELEKVVGENKGRMSNAINPELFKVIEKALGKFEIIL